MVFKLSVALVGALAVVAQAGYGRRHVQQHKHLSYGNNQTTSVADTSSTVANSPETTSTAPLETFPTFTPESSTSVYGSPSSSVGPTAPLTTAPSGTSDNSPAPIGGNHTLTYTLGTGSSTTVVTTTIQETSTKTNVNTIYATSNSEAGATGGAAGDNEPTTTIVSTSTSTIYKTIKPSSSGIVENSPVGASGSSKCPVPVTVTVTGAPVVSIINPGLGNIANLFASRLSPLLLDRAQANLQKPPRPPSAPLHPTLSRLRRRRRRPSAQRLLPASSLSHTQPSPASQAPTSPSLKRPAQELLATCKLPIGS